MYTLLIALYIAVGVLMYNRYYQDFIRRGGFDAMAALDSRWSPEFAGPWWKRAYLAGALAVTLLAWPIVSIARKIKTGNW